MTDQSEQFHEHISRQSKGGRDTRSRDAILAADHWSKLRSNSYSETMQVTLLRQADQFFRFCIDRGLNDIKVEDVMDFDPYSSPSSLQRLRDTLRALYGLQHPITHVIDHARRKKCRAHRLKTGRSGLRRAMQKQAKLSVPSSELPATWQNILDELQSGQRIRRRKCAPSIAKNMRSYARQLIWSARNAGLPDEISIATLGAYDADLTARGLRPSSCTMQFGFIGQLAFFLRLDDDLQEAIKEVAGHYRRSVHDVPPMRQARFAQLPAISTLFEIAYDLLDMGLLEDHSTMRATYLVDAGAIAFLTLIPLRSADTVLRWGEHLTVNVDSPDDWRYRIDSSISKTSVDFGGDLHPILNTFLEALLLQGRHEAFLPRLRAEAIANCDPVFPKSSGRARSALNLSRRWRARLGTGSHIARTQAHTLLGALGPKGVNSALNLCAQRSFETRRHYQDASLHLTLMSESQERLSATLPIELIAERMKGSKINLA